MTKLEWNQPQDQTFQAGLDRGVLYVEDGETVAWSGLVSVQDTGESEISEFYLDGVKYLSTVSPRDWKGELTAYTYPDEFGPMIGLAELGDGFYVDGQMPQRFGLSYRTMITTPGVDKKQHYKIHLIYKVMAAMGEFSHDTLSEDVEPLEFSFELSAVPVQVPGYRPSSHFVLDTRKMDDSTIAELEGIIYGNDFRSPGLPTVDELIDLLKYADGVTVVYNNDGTWTAYGPNKDIRMVDQNGGFEIKNVGAEYLTEDIYRFTGVNSTGKVVVDFDTDGVPFFSVGEGITNMAFDTDGVPYIESGVNGATILEDVDGVPYVVNN